MKVVSLDCESHRFKDGCKAPKLVCLTWSFDEQSASILGGDAEGVQAAMALVRELLEQAARGELKIIGQWIFYDMGVFCAEDPTLIPLVFEAFFKGMISCTKIRQMLIDNALGELKYVWSDTEEKICKNDFSLQRLVKRHLDVWLPKTETPRLEYYKLDGVPISEWPEDAKRYAMRDAMYTLSVWWVQDEIAGKNGIPGEAHTMRSGWALYLMHLWGVRTDPTAVAELEKMLDHDLAEIKKKLLEGETGLLRVDGTRNMNAIKERLAACFREQNKHPSFTPTGQIQTDRDSLLEANDEPLRLISEWVRLGKVKSTYVKALWTGTKVPINPSYNPVLETLRTSCAKPNVQNPPRKGGVRECFVPRPGHVFAGADFDTAELRSLAQVCYDLFGYSAMGEALKADKDLHIDLASELVATPYDELYERYKAGDTYVEDARQFCKIGNFGLPGGMGAPAFQDYAKSNGKIITMEEAIAIHKGFPRKWFEMPEYFQFCKNLAGADEAPRVIFVRSGMVRGKVRYTAICNGFFQHLTAMGAKDACADVARECYVGLTPEGKRSPLFGCRPVLFLHDEIIIEIPEISAEFVHLATMRLAEVMKKAMEKWITDLPVKCSPVVTRKWWKGAKAIYGSDGLIVPVKPVKEGNKVKWVADLEDDVRLAA